MRRLALRGFCGVWGLAIMLSGLTSVPAETVDFEDEHLNLDLGSYWNGPDPNGEEVTGPYGGTIREGSFESGGVEFINRYNETFESWSGFAYSNTTDNTTAGFTNQYSAYTGSGYGSGDDNYGVAFGYDDTLGSNAPNDVSELEVLPYFELPDGATIESAYVTNTTYAALSMLNGDSFAKQFGGPTGDDSDWFKLTVFGSDANSKPLSDTVDFYLADYRFEDNSEDYIVDKWTNVDLSDLAGAERLYFNTSSSDVGDFGMNTPGYFAIDNITYQPVPEPSTLVLLTLGCLAAALVSVRARRPSRGV